jgi:DNA-binding NarL/FixJ family response regulator
LSKRPRRILIADDHPAIREGVRHLLEGNGGWQIVAQASNGHEALQLARETRPDIAILDYTLPQMDGLELTRAIRHALPRTEVLIYTMHEQECIVAEILRAGARGYVLKSDPGEHLIAAVEALARGRPWFSAPIWEVVRESVVQHADSMIANELTTREREIVQLIAEGMINKQVAHVLGISVKTVETHRAAVMEKLRLRTTAELVRYAVRNYMVKP